MKTTANNLSMLAAACMTALLLAPSAKAQTYLWADNAQGQVYQTCPVIGAEYWPSNTVWSQSAHLGRNCDGSAYVFDQPSNWNPWPDTGVYPNGPGVNVILGEPANTILDVNVTLDSLTLQPNGGLTVNQTLTANHIELQGDGNITGLGGPGSTGHGGALNIASGGSLTKSGGSGSFSFGTGPSGVTLSGDNCSLIIQSGILELPFNSGNGGTLYNTTLALSNQTSLLLRAPESTNYEHAFIGTLTGIGTGKVLWNEGQIWCSGWDLSHNYHQGLTLNFPGDMLQWSGGGFASGGPVTNTGVINITNTGAWVYGVTLLNRGIVNLAPDSLWGLNAGSGIFNNQADGTAYLLGDTTITGTGQIFNYGLIRKTAGTGTAFIYPKFMQYSGTVEVDSGTLALNLGGFGGYFTNATFVVSNGATLDLLISNYNIEVEGTITGLGNGTVLMNNGTLSCNYPTTLNFPGAMFQWQGGTLAGGSYSMVNVGTINLSGPGSIVGYLTNSGTIVQTGSGAMLGAGGFQNNVGGVYDLQNDNNISAVDIYNFGLLQKSAGTGTNSFNAHLYNYGSIAASTGGLNFGGSLFNQNAGTFLLTPAFTFGANQTVNLNGGTISGAGTLGGSGANDYVLMNGGALVPGNPVGTINVPRHFQVFGGALNIQIAGLDQFSQVIAGDSSYIAGGALNVTIADGYTPPVGTRFHIVSCPQLAGWGFASVNVPQGISVTYSNTGVYLTVLPPPAQITDPHLSGTNFVFGFRSLTNQSYTVEANSDLSTRNWTFYTNLLGDGTVQQIVVPAQNPQQRFFRVREP